MDGIYGTFGETPDYEWVEKNAYKYGFILRFPENASDKTGATNEPWHFRYVVPKKGISNPNHIIITVVSLI